MKKYGETLEKQKRIRENYFSLFKRFPEENVKIVRSEKDKELTQKNLRAIADQLFGWQA